MSVLKEWLAGIIPLLEAHGTLGLLALSFLDSFVPLPNVVDGLVLYVAYRTRDPVTPALAALAGSTVGTLAFYLMVRSGRNLIPYSRRATARLDHISALIGKYDLLAIFAAAALPPPFPLKAVVISAGLLRFNTARFLAAYTAGRALRFFTESTLAFFFGEQAVRVMKEHYPVVAVTVVAMLIGAVICLRRLNRRPAA